MHIGENIKLKRENLGLTRNDLIERSGISIAQLSRIERGEQRNPNLETLVAISTALNTSIDEIVFGEESSSSIFLGQAIEGLPENRKKFVKDLIRMSIMMSKSDEIENKI